MIRHLLGRRVGTELERARVEGEQREAVGEHVVHLARDAAVTVTVQAPDGDLRVEVQSLAPVGVASASPLPGAGTGLIGLAERVTLAGGELESGVDADGSFVLRARLPR